MATYVPFDVLEVQIKGNIWTSDCMNVLHFLSKPATQDSIAVAAELTAGLMSSVRGLIAQGYTWTGFKIRKISPGPVTPYETVLYTGLQPFGNANGFPPQLCALWGLRTAISSVPEGRGRVYWPALPAGSWAAGVWSAGYINSHNTAMAAVLARYKLGGTSTSLTMIVRSDPTGTNSPITGIVLRPQPAVQRSRRINF